MMTRLFIAEWQRGRSPQETEAYLAAGMMVLCAFLLHLLWLIFYAFLSFPAMVFINCAGLFFNALLFFLSRSGATAFSAMAVSIEVMGYSAFASVVLGWNSSCQWYILLAVLPHYLFVRVTPSQRSWLTLFGLALLLMSFFLCNSYVSPHAEGDKIVIRFINILLIFSLTLLETLGARFIKSPSGQGALGLPGSTAVDPLTKLWNRQFAEHYFQMLQIKNSRYCVALLQIDVSRRVREEIGEGGMERVVCHLAAMLQKRFFASDAAIRWGAKEFMMILHKVDLYTAFSMMDEFREIVSRQRLSINGREVQFTVTVGLTEHEAGSGKSMEQLVEECAECMAIGAGNGRNQVVYPETAGLAEI